MEKALTNLGAFTPTDEDAVRAAKRAADTATSNRTVECDKRGPNCRARELDEQTAASHLATVTAAKATTDRARQLEAENRVVRTRLNAGEPISNPNPLGNALALLLGEAASVLTAWQQAIVAAVFELCLVGVMVIFELLGHARQHAEERVIAARSQETLNTAKEVAEPQLSKPLTSSTPRRRKVTLTRPKVMGSIKSFVRDHVYPADGERTEIKALMQDYRAWCAQEGFAPVELSELLDEIEKVCRKLGIEIEVGADQRVYCVGVKIDKVAAVERPRQPSAVH